MRGCEGELVLHVFQTLKDPHNLGKIKTTNMPAEMGRGLGGPAPHWIDVSSSWLLGRKSRGCFYCCSFFQGCLSWHDNPCIHTGYLKNKTHESRRGMGEEWAWMWQRLGSNYDNKNSLYTCMKFSRKKWSYLTKTSQCFCVDDSTYLEHPWLGGSFLVAPVCPLYLPMCLM